MQEILKNVVSFILSFMILMKKVDFRVLPRGVPTERHNLVSSLEYLVSNGRQVLLGGIRLGGSATSAISDTQLQGGGTPA